MSHKSPFLRFRERNLLKNSHSETQFVFEVMDQNLEQGSRNIRIPLHHIAFPTELSLINHPVGDNRPLLRPDREQTEAGDTEQRRSFDFVSQFVPRPKS